MLPGKNQMIIALPPSDIHKTVELAAGQFIEIRNLLQDQYSYEPVVAILVEFDPKELANHFNTKTMLEKGMFVLVDYRAGMRGLLLETKEDGTRLISCEYRALYGYLDGDDCLAYGQNLFLHIYDQEQDCKNSFGLYVSEPLPFQVQGILFSHDPGYKYGFDLAENARVVYYSDTDVEFVYRGQKFLAVRYKDVLAVIENETVKSVKDSVVMKPVGLESKYLDLSGTQEQGFSIVIESQDKRLPAGATVCHNRGELVMPFKYKYNQYRLTKTDFCYAVSV